MKEALERYLQWWSARVRAGEVSGLSGIEILTLTGFAHWLHDEGYVLLDTKNKVTIKGE